MASPSTLTLTTALEALARAARGGRIFVQAGAGEPLALHDGWRAAPELAAGLSFAGLFVPGVNRTDYALFHPEARMEFFMLSPDWRGGFDAGRSLLRPLHFSASHRLLVREGAAAGVFHVSPPGPDGRCSFGVSAEIAPAMLARTGYKLGLINHMMPRAAGAPSAPLDVFDALLEVSCPLAESPTPRLDARDEAIGRRAAEFVRDGDVIQSGIGRLPVAAALALEEKNDLSIHSGLVNEAHHHLMRRGVIRRGSGAVTVGMALGRQAFYESIAPDADVTFVDVSGTHYPGAFDGISNLVALNAALEIDLFGQINAEFAGEQQISGVGGSCDFVRGCHASPGGRPIVMIAATGKGGESRVVPRLGAPTLSRADAPIVVTEYGAVDLNPLPAAARAEAIISLAAPEHRPMLQAAWADLRF